MLLTWNKKLFSSFWKGFQLSEIVSDPRVDLKSGVYRYKSNVKIFWIIKKAFDLWVYLCLVFTADFCGLALVDVCCFSKNTWTPDWQVTWKTRWGTFTLTHNPTKCDGNWCCETGDALFCEYEWSHDRLVTWLNGGG